MSQTEFSPQRKCHEAFRISSQLYLPPDYIFCFLKTSRLDLPPPSDNRQLNKLILRCLEKDPNDRYQSFSELKEELLWIYRKVMGREYEIIEELPQKPNWRNRGKTYFILGREEEAVKLYDKALEENPGDTTVWLEKGFALAEMGKIEGFRTCMEISSYLQPSKREKISEKRYR